jgi:hypothetical protein
LSNPAIEAKFQVGLKAVNAFNAVLKELAELGITDFKIIKEIPLPSPSSSRKPSYVLLEYRLGRFGFDRRQIELFFNENPTNTVISVKWHYPTYENDIARARAERKEKEAKQDTIRLVEILKSRMGAIEIAKDEATVAKTTSVKEIIKEIQVVVKVRCPYCLKLYDETLDKCPHCGGHI